ncbi:phage integrase family protein [Sulfitobacter mediterraneus]|uniref:Phage integrase family protein n=2 Tax=Sulfitobacter mediterraneus TaxID=83219 RepID=A0A2T6CHB8_9RHOB|nr:Integrase [Sulfitobacter mediterraneus KCTC 32188]PTX74896.1 phage integrase family protein [Sulfitobacter mediterraneus]
MSKSYLNKVELKGGQIILFHRQNAQRPVYHMRIHVRGMKDIRGNKVTYVQRSTGETDLEEARRIALDAFDDLKLKARAKQAVTTLTFSEMYELWWESKKKILEQQWFAKGRTGKNKRVEWYEKHAQRYWLAYFGKHKVEELTHSFVQGYWNWRQTYWARASEEERKKYPNHAINPAKKSLDMEQSALREVFGWANSMKLINYTPLIQNPYARKGIKPKRRASFDESEFLLLQDYMAEWVQGRGKHDRRVNAAHKRNRKLLQIYVHFLAYTGMRTGEVLKLKHKDIGYALIETRETGLVIQVADDTKTGAREVTSTADLVDWYEELCKLTGHTERDDWLFCNWQGKQITGFYKTFAKLLDEAELLYTENGDRRSAYSLRHYYAEQMFAEIGHTHAVLDMLATNMGTGRDYLESYYIRRGLIDGEALVRTRHGYRGVDAVAHDVSS